MGLEGFQGNTRYKGLWLERQLDGRTEKKDAQLALLCVCVQHAQSQPPIIKAFLKKSPLDKHVEPFFLLEKQIYFVFPLKDREKELPFADLLPKWPQ